MESSEKKSQKDVQLRVGFPKSSEDHRLKLIEINGSIFAILHAPLESLGPIRLYCEEWNLVLLAPIKSKTNIVVTAANIIWFNEITSEEGNVSVHASKKLVKFSRPIQPGEKVCEIGEGGEYQFGDDPGALLHYFRLFESIVDAAYTNTPDSISEAQQKFIMALCTLADKLEGSSTNLDLRQVLKLWGIENSTIARAQDKN